MRRNKKISIWAAATLLFAACEPAPEETDAGPTINATSVNVIQVEQGVFAHYFEVHGTVQSDQNILINAELPGLISSIRVQVGDMVTKGTTLATIDQGVIAGSIEEVKTALALAEDVYQRQKNLWDQGVGSELQYIQAENQVKQLEDKLNTLKAQQSMAIISAPFDGVVDEIFANEGEMATGQFPILRLVNLDQVYIEADVSERYLRNVKQGMEVMVEFPSIEEKAEAMITYVGQYISPANRTFKVRVEMDNPDGILKPNLLAYMSIMDEVDSSAIVVPSSVLSDRGTSPYLYVVKAGDSITTAQQVSVEEGMYYDNRSAIVSGLSVGDVVILDHLLIEDGAPIIPRMKE